MAKESGLGMALSVDDSGGTLRVISNDVTDMQWGMPSGEQDVTGLDKSAHERLLLLADFSITLTAVFTDLATTGMFQIFKNYRTILAGQVGRTVTIAASGQSLSNEVIFTDFPFSRNADGSLTSSIPGVLSDGTVPVWV